VTEANSTFPGFVSGGAATTLPAQLFVELFPAIEDEAELRVTMYALYAIGRQRGPLRAVRATELAAQTPLARSFTHRGGADAIRAALDQASARGTLLALPLADGDALYFVHNEAGRRQLLRVRSGALEAPGVALAPAAPVAQPAARPAAAYEQEIGTITPSVAEALQAAAERWSEAWIVEAIGIAARRNARSWRYAEAILERWEAEGRDDATTGTTAGESASDRDHGPYERVIHRS
jgi:DNA replication protein